MARLIAIEGVTLDGVMQAPAAPDEDTRGGAGLAALQPSTPAQLDSGGVLRWCFRLLGCLAS